MCSSHNEMPTQTIDKIKYPKIRLATSGLSAQQICTTAARTKDQASWSSSNLRTTPNHAVIVNRVLGRGGQVMSAGESKVGGSGPFIRGRGRRSLLVSGAHARSLTHLPAPRRRRADSDLVTPRLANQPTNSRPADVVTRWLLKVRWTVIKYRKEIDVPDCDYERLLIEQ